MVPTGQNHSNPSPAKIAGRKFVIFLISSQTNWMRKNNWKWNLKQDGDVVDQEEIGDQDEVWDGEAVSQKSQFENVPSFPADTEFAGGGPGKGNIWIAKLSWFVVTHFKLLKCGNSNLCLDHKLWVAQYMGPPLKKAPKFSMDVK